MSEFDADLKRLFAQSREEFDGATFRADVAQRIARARKAQYLNDAVLVAVIGVAAMVGAPLVMNYLGTLSTEVMSMEVVGSSLALSTTTGGAWITAGVMSVAALVWARV